MIALPPTERAERLIERLRALRRLTVTELQERHARLVGRPTRSRNGEHLRRAIVARLMDDAPDLSGHERLARRLDRAAREAVRPPRRRRAARARRRDPRIPPVGTVLRRRHRGRAVAVRVQADGFQYQGRRYRSLSAIAREVSGAHWNGLLFFGLAERSRGKGGRP